MPESPARKAKRLVTERESLVAALRKHGVDYLVPTDAKLEAPIEDEVLLASLAAHEDPRLRQALIALFLLHPELSGLVRRARDRLQGRTACELMAFYTAAVYLQRMWRIRLGQYLPAFIEMPDHFSAELCLPRTEEEHGKVGLHRLAEWHSTLDLSPRSHLSEYEGVADLLFQSLRLKKRQDEPAPKR